MDPQEEANMQALLLNYVSLLAERNGFAPGDLFEYKLWDDVDGLPPPLRYLSNDEAAEVTGLAMATDSWVAYDDDTRMFKLIPMDEWMQLLMKRGH